MARLDLLLDDSHIVAVVGEAAFRRGSAYARNGHVVGLQIDEGAGDLSASVVGSGGMLYRTSVSVEPGRRPGAVELDTDCTCPVGLDCKHAAAVMITARRQLDRRSAGRPGRPADTVAEWERVLEPVLAPPGPTPDGAPMALELEVVSSAPSAPRVFGRATPALVPARRVRLRPLAMGKTGKWVRSGASWRDLAYGYGAGAHLPEHRAALRELHNLYRSADNYSYLYDDHVYLDAFSASWWRLLDQLLGSGVELVQKPRSKGGVVVAEDPVTVALDLRRSGSGVELVPRVSMGEQDLAAEQVDLVGSPPHGVVVHRPQELVLARLEEPLRPAVATLLRRGDPLHVPQGDFDRFLADFFPRLRREVPVVSSDASVSLPEVSPPRLAVVVRYSDGHRLAVEWQWEYSLGKQTRTFPLEAAGGADLRDLPAEQRLLDRVYTADDLLPRLCGTGPHGYPLPAVLLGGMDAVLFVDEALPRLLEHPDVVVHEHGDRPDFRAAENAPVVEMTATESDDPDWFDLGVTVSVDGEQIPLEDLIRALARGATHMVLPSGTWLRIDRDELHQLRRLIEEARALQDRPGGGTRLRLSPYQAGLWQELAELGVVTEQSRRWAAVVEGLVGVGGVEPTAAPATLSATLRPYQLEGFQWLSFLWDHQLGGILADDMGLGKTLQTLAVVCRAKEAGRLEAPVLVVAPTSVVANWAAEAARFAPGLAVVTVAETERRRGVPLADDVAGADVVITSYALFRLGYDAYADLPWSALVLDEAQFVKNHQAKTYQCVRRLPAPVKLAITGTPLENSLMDLWAMLSIVAPGLFPSPDRFSEFYRRPIERGDAPELLAALRRRVRPLMLRRTKEQVAADLPAKQEQVLEVALTPKHRRIYDTHLARERQKVLGLIDDLDKNRFTILKSLTLLRQLSLAPSLVDQKYAGVHGAKIEVLLEHLGEVTEGGHRALVFSQFTGFLHQVRDRLDAEGIGYAYLDGRTRDRARVIDRFKSGDAPVFLISLKAGGFGLNLTEADYCFVLDPWWNPASEAQAVDRTHRIGQDKTVVVYRMVSTDTIEEKVMALKERKSALFKSVMDEDALLSAPLSAEDIRGLLGA